MGEEEFLSLACILYIQDESGQNVVRRGQQKQHVSCLLSRR